MSNAVNENRRLLLPCNFTEEEKIALAKDLARATVEIQEYQQRLKDVTAQLKAKITSCESMMKLAAQRIHDGYEIKEVDCIVDFNSPVRGQKTITRLDTNQVFVETMTTEEKADLFFNVDKEGNDD